MSREEQLAIQSSRCPTVVACGYGCYNGCGEGCHGLVQDPVQGCQATGCCGLCGGICTGVTGVVTRPIARILHDTSQGLAADSLAA